MQSVRPLKDATELKEFGGKAFNLATLLQHNLPVPNGVAVGLKAFDDNGKLTQESQDEIRSRISAGKLYAVRSSALAEDAEGASWAGQFESFLNTSPQDIIAKVELCHASAKNRAKAYAEDKTGSEDFEVAVVIQEMLNPEYAGVLFTKDPMGGSDAMVTEYVDGLAEELVSGRADPVRATLGVDQTPFNGQQLAELAAEVEKLFGVPQDIEWVYAENKTWFVQARPITVTQQTREGYDLGEPNDLFYWGPSRAKSLYMSDFMAAAERFFINMTNDSELPSPPKTLVLFDEGKMVWLNNAKEFAEFTERTFEAYEKQDRLDDDIAKWRAATEKLDGLTGDALMVALVEAWFHTEFAEFSLYGSETNLIKRLNRFDSQARQEIWSTFTVPDKPTFLSKIDSELAESQDPEAMAKKYPWIQDGYDGISPSARQYFTNRLEVIRDNAPIMSRLETSRQDLINHLQLKDEEVNALTLARRLAEFMDDRKAWMMQTRRMITKAAGKIEHGWFFNAGQVSLLGKDDTHDLWQRYIDYKASTNVLAGLVASNGGKQFVNGEVIIVANPADVVPDGKIVVVPSTSPSYVPLMRKAKALVTDHGGMMSHAAIVAREFNLPCIVGTKQGTKVLSTGDKVVLDLVTGEVNK